MSESSSKPSGKGPDAPVEDAAEAQEKAKPNSSQIITATMGRSTKRKFLFDGCFPVARAQPVKFAKRETLSNVRVLTKCIEVAKPKKKGAKSEEEGQHSWAPVRLTKIGQRMVRVPKALQSKNSIPTKASRMTFVQVGNAGPAAYLPEEVILDSIEDAASLFDAFSPASRPFLVATPAEEEGKASKEDRGLSEFLTAHGKAAVVELRTVEGLAMAPNSISTFRGSSVERLALLPIPEAEGVLGGYQVEAPGSVLALFLSR